MKTNHYHVAISAFILISCLAALMILGLFVQHRDTVAEHRRQQAEILQRLDAAHRRADSLEQLSQLVMLMAARQQATEKGGQPK
jgi:hypothetical protein